uniref:Pectinesterase catalytic domain-containing protein n=1 Tax=Nymphaea colorata TaxID=210225 RepID=A0A5K1ET33_9MAGN|nr:unnamed protein product [Nymphaea colorata]
MALQTVGSVVVAQDGSGNYLTIGHAIAAAPAKNDGSKGFFLIRVKAGCTMSTLHWTRRRST